MHVFVGRCSTSTSKAHSGRAKNSPCFAEAHPSLRSPHPHLGAELHYPATQSPCMVLSHQDEYVLEFVYLFYRLNFLPFSYHFPYKLNFLLYPCLLPHCHLLQFSKETEIYLIT